MGDGGAATKDAACSVGVEVLESKRGFSLDVLFPENLALLGGADFATERVDSVVGDGSELALHFFGQLNAELALQ